MRRIFHNPAHNIQSYFSWLCTSQLPIYLYVHCTKSLARRLALSTIFLLLLQKKFLDYPEKSLEIQAHSQDFRLIYYQFTTFNGLRLDMPEHLASMKQPNTNATHWRRGTSAITQFHIAPHWRRYLIPTVKQGTPLFFYPHVTQ